MESMVYDESMRPAHAYGYAGIVEGKGVCGDYAEMFCLLANHAGIEAYVCEECGEEVYTSTEAKMIERVVTAVKENETEEKSVYNLSETAEYLRLSNQTIYNMIKDGSIKAYKIGRE